MQQIGGEHSSLCTYMFLCQESEEKGRKCGIQDNTELELWRMGRVEAGTSVGCHMLSEWQHAA